MLQRRPSWPACWTPRDVSGALAHTAAVIYGLLVVTAASGGTELALIAAQDELVHPSHTFEPVRLR